VTPRVLDVSALPDVAFGHRSTLWWATMGIIAIEGTMFALAEGSQLQLAARSRRTSIVLGDVEHDRAAGVHDSQPAHETLRREI
jgi:hypothetical protein